MIADRPELYFDAPAFRPRDPFAVYPKKLVECGQGPMQQLQFLYASREKREYLIFLGFL
jgi:hypothetical protein